MNVTPIAARPNFSVLNEQIYGYKHGIRPLVLQTMQMKDKQDIENRLQRDKLDYYLQPAPGEKNLNVFFGDKPCVDVIKSFQGKALSPSSLSPEQDFILGVLLGYDRTKQCERYLKLKEAEANPQKPAFSMTA